MDPGQIQGVKSWYTKKIFKQISKKSFTSVIAQIDKEKKKILFVALPALTSPSPQKLVLILLCYGILRIRREVANPDPGGSHRALIFFFRAPLPVPPPPPFWLFTIGVEAQNGGLSGTFLNNKSV